MILKSRKKIEAILKQRQPIKEIIDRTEHKKLIARRWVKTGIEGFDKLLEKGIPFGSSVLVAGGAGSGKTIFCLQVLNNSAENKEKCLYISLEESEKRLKEHMGDFGWNIEKLEKEGMVKIKRIDPFAIARTVEAMLAKERGELKMNLEKIDGLVPKGFKPDLIFIDSLTALSAAFKEEEDSYRIFIEQLFKYFEKLNVTSFFVSETEQIPTRFSKTGVEEFLADGVVVLYHLKIGNIRERAIEILKLRGAKHQEKIVAMQIQKEGIKVYPEQEVYSDIETEK